MLLVAVRLGGRANTVLISDCRNTLGVRDCYLFFSFKRLGSVFCFPLSTALFNSLGASLGV